jgi:hypothetical protein
LHSSRLALLVVLLLTCAKVYAVEEFMVELKNHLFYPSLIEIPANQKVKLIIHNLDPTPEEFDSFELNREKVIFAGRKATIFIGPLKPGTYNFFGEYNPNTARGTVISVEKSPGETDVD